MRNIKTYNRYFSFILYKEDSEQMKAMEYIIRNFKYARIYHDRDKEDEETMKKPHYHIIINVGKNPRNRRAVAKEIGIKENYIEGCNKENMLLYLIHYNNPEKTQYDVEEVDGEMASELIKIIESKTELPTEKLKNILQTIYDKNIRTVAQITDYCIYHNYYQVLKQNQYLITKIITERNCNNVSERLQKRTRD